MSTLLTLPEYGTFVVEKITRVSNVKPNPLGNLSSAGQYFSQWAGKNTHFFHIVSTSEDLRLHFCSEEEAQACHNVVMTALVASLFGDHEWHKVEKIAENNS